MRTMPVPARASGAAAGYASCRTCHATVRLRAARARRAGRPQYCPVCHARLHVRARHSLQRTWALLITALICYVPANIYPIMTVTRLGRGQPDTIASGIVHLVHDGQWPIALLVFFASIVVPVAKMGALALLLVSVQGRWRWRVAERAQLFHVVDLIGRWSMIDIFMISILVALVHLGAVANVTPGVGAGFFSAVVITTMLAAATFDPRLLWDAADD
ncbi:MAG: paraquat-inducible protein A [Gammaproteobacteria bacterium]